MTKTWKALAVFSLFYVCLMWGWDGLAAEPAAQPGEAEDETGPAGQPAEAKEEAKPADMATLMQQLRSRFYEDRLDAAFQMIEMGKPAMEELRKGLNDPDTRFAIDCIDVLLMLGDKSILPDLIKIAHTARHAMLRETALRAIDVIDPFQKMTEKLAEGELKQAAESVKTVLKARNLSSILTNDIEQYVVSYLSARNMVNVFGIMDNAEAAALVERAQEFVRLGKTEEALKTCQEILRLHISGGVPDPEEPSRLVGLTPASLPILRDMNEETLKKYRAMFDEEAAAALASAKAAGGISDLYEVLMQYLYTSCGEETFERIVEVQYEQGDYESVVWTWSGYGALLRNASLPVLAHLCLSACNLADKNTAVETLALVRERFPDGRILAEGGEVSAVEYLSGKIAAMPKYPPATARRGDSTIYGSPFEVEAKWGDFDLSKPAWVRATGALYKNGRAQVCMDLATGKQVYVPEKEVPRDIKEQTEFFRKRNLENLFMGVGYSENGGAPYGDHPFNPVVHEGRVIINNGQEVLCIAAENGEIIWRHAVEIDALGLLSVRRPADPAMFNLQRPIKFPFTTVVPREKAIYVTMESDYAATKGKEDFLAAFKPPGLYFTDSELKCLDYETGKVRWTTYSTGNPFLQGLLFYSAPKYDSGVLYCTVMPAKWRKEYSEIYVLALDAGTGRLLWKARLGQAVVYSKEFLDQRPIVGSTPEVYGNTVIAQTNFGMVASIRAADGMINWVAKYEQAAPLNLQAGPAAESMTFGDTEDRTCNPPVVWGGTVFVLPNDANYLMAFDASSGRLLWRIGTIRPETRRIFIEPQRFKQFLIDTDGTVFLTGNGVLAIDRDGAVKWEHRTAGTVKEMGANGLVYKTGGRAALLTDSVAVPEADGILFLSKTSGKIVQSFDLKTHQTLLDRIEFLLKKALGEDGDAAFRELLLFGRDSVVLAAAAAEKAEGDEKTALQDLSKKLESELTRSYFDRTLVQAVKVTGNVLVTSDLLLITTSQGDLIAYRKK